MSAPEVELTCALFVFGCAPMFVLSSIFELPPGSDCMVIVIEGSIIAELLLLLPPPPLKLFVFDIGGGRVSLIDITGCGVVEVVGVA